MIVQLTTMFNLHNGALLVTAAITFAFGFWEYIYSFRLTFRENKSPFPIWMHTFYFAHDSSWAIILFLMAPRYHWHWFLVGTSVALVVWTLFEVVNIYHAIMYERQEIWTSRSNRKLTIGQACGYVFEQIICFYAVVNLIRLFMGFGSFFQWTVLTNMVMAVGPGLLWRQRGSRDGASVGLAIVIVLGTVNTFLPISMFVTTLPGVFDHLWYYLAGVVVSAIAIKNLWMILQFPAKSQKQGAKRPIW